MLRLNRLAITQFKNCEFGEYEFKEKVVGITGLNGVGKTSLLDAIYYCCFTKSYFSVSDSNNVLFDRQGFRIESTFLKNNSTNQILCIYRGNKKEFSNNHLVYGKLSEHIGQFPAVIIAPDDIELITGGSELRRRLMDTLICQLNPNYLQNLVIYNKVLQQRNSFLKKAAETGNVDQSLLNILNHQLSEPATIIYEERMKTANELKQLVENYYAALCGNDEKVNLYYDSQLHQTKLDILLQQNLQKDLALQRTSAGLHRDDLKFSLNDQSFKLAASQGQRKTLLFAIKLAEFEILKMHLGLTPILLLDDVFEKLDEVRMHQLLNKVCVENEGQVFITDTHKDRLVKALDDLTIPYQLIELEKQSIN